MLRRGRRPSVSDVVTARFKEPICLLVGRPALCNVSSFVLHVRSISVEPSRRWRSSLVVLGADAVDATCRLLLRKNDTTLSGGSLGSCVDEERSQLRELM